MKRLTYGILVVLIVLIFGGCQSPTTETPKSNSKQITSFNFTVPLVTGNIIEETHKINLVVPLGTNLTNLTPTITTTGNSVTPNSGVSQDFSIDVVYVVKAEDGSQQNYTVSVSYPILVSPYQIVYKANRANSTDVSKDLNLQGLYEANSGDFINYFSFANDPGTTVNYLKIDTTKPGSNKFAYAEKKYLATTSSWPKNATIVLRAKGLSSMSGIMGISVNLSEPGQTQTDLRTDGFAKTLGFGNTSAYNVAIDPLQWHIYRITYRYQLDHSFIANVYVDENTSASIVDAKISQSGNTDGSVSIGDGSGNNTVSCLYDFIILTFGDAYSPSEKSISNIESETGVKLQ